MKKYVIVVVILALVITGGILERRYVENSFNEFNTRVEQIAVKAEAKTVKKQDAEALTAWWEDNKFGLDFVVPHINITEIDMRLAEMTALIEMKKFEEAYAQTSILKSLGDRVKQLLSS